MPDPLISFVNRITMQLDPRAALISDILSRAHKHFQQGEFAEAKALINDCPAHPDAIFLLGLIAQAKEDYQEAEKLIKIAIRLNPKPANYHAHLGVALAFQGKLAEAKASLKKAIAINPSEADYVYSLGIVLVHMGQAQEVIVPYEKAISCSPDNLVIHLRFFELLMFVGDYERAWKQLEKGELLFNQIYELVGSRDLGGVPSAKLKEILHDEITQLVGNILDSVPIWKGRAQSLEAKSILLYSNPGRIFNGLGDVILLLRYLPQLASLGANIFLVVPYPLRSLASQLPVTIWTKELSQSEFDYRLPLLLLPGRFGTITPDLIPAPPYLTPEYGLVAHWKKRFAEFSGLQVGLCWRARDDSSRTIKPQDIARLLSVPGVSFFSLQVHEKASDDLQVIRSYGELTDLASELTDFHQTAAAIAALDLVISVDTSVANLCGSMARHDWVMLPLFADFRWSGWFPTMRLFKQSASGQWQSVLDEVIEQLKVEASTKLV